MLTSATCGTGPSCQRWSFSRQSLTRLPPLGALLFVFIYFTFFSRNGRLLDTVNSPTRQQSQNPSRLIPYAVLNRGHSARDKELTAARQTLEYWWSLKFNESNGKSEACPLSISGPPRKNKNRRFDFFILQAIEIMEAMGFTNVTTCYGRYPTFANVTPYEKPNGPILGLGKSDSSPLTHNVVFSSAKTFAGRPHDKMAELLVETQAVQTHNEDMITRKFCYTPSFRPQQQRRENPPGRLVRGNTSQDETEAPQLDPGFCSRLLDLYRAITAGTEPPLLTLFTWFPDVLDDPVRDLRRLMLVNMDQFRPFVQPVLVSDRRMVMSLANGLSWPCLPISEYSPDGFPVFKAASNDITNTFNSTFYGYVQRKSLLDASLLETLMAVKERYLSRREIESSEDWQDIAKSRDERESSELYRKHSANRGAPSVLMYGPAMFTKSLATVKNHHGLSVLAQARQGIDLNKLEAIPAYVIYNKKVSFSDLPPLKIDDAYLIPLLASRSRALGHVVLDTGSTILSLYTFNNNTLSDWGRKFLVSTFRNQTYNKLLSDMYLKNIQQRILSSRNTLVMTEFDKGGNILFKESDVNRL
ncbi:hypothetical protein ElyMa_004313300 [Elysia marginata]|uniref:Uncharacterized protein n=1 Tax=Elysia marginata TaxID=1093978 RepID=A0AAV4GZW7_9GAST|nr:hypothetical protein ElyMa_004313300 [Elysia marginata]